MTIRFGAVETYKQFTFEAAHQTPPFSGLHGHSFVVCVYLQGEPDPVYGWSHNLDEVEGVITNVKRKIDHKYLNDVAGLEVPTLENLTRWLFNEFSSALQGVDRIAVQRGTPGQSEGCTFGKAMRPQAA
jgi:6-pyruvoyltetrahydropterin/6-carboxytetrahydropterin synthase